MKEKKFDDRNLGEGLRDQHYSDKGGHLLRGIYWSWRRGQRAWGRGVVFGANVWKEPELVETLGRERHMRRISVDGRR